MLLRMGDQRHVVVTARKRSSSVNVTPAGHDTRSFARIRQTPRKWGRHVNNTNVSANTFCTRSTVGIPGLKRALPPERLAGIALPWDSEHESQSNVQRAGGNRGGVRRR